MADAEGQRGLAGRRAGAEHEQGVGLQARQQLVEVEEAGGQAGDGLAPLVELLEPVEVGVEQVVDLAMVSVTRRWATSNTMRLGPVDDLGDVVGQVVAHLGDLAGHADEPPQQRVLLDDAGVAAGVGRGRGGRLQVDQRGRTADGLEQAGPAQLVGHRDRVGRLTGRRRAS